MHIHLTSTARAAAIALIITVATQIIYITLSNTGVTPNRQVIWSTEVLAFLAISVTGLVLLPVRPLIGAGLAVGGVLNVIQAGMGLVMFPPLMEAGDALGPVFSAVLAMAFLLFHAGKVAFGVAAMAIARDLWHTGGVARAIGALAGITGLAAALLNAIAIAMADNDLMFPAGAAGTAAALFLALGLTVLRPVTTE
ncbi:hypothetical protein [Aurantiacibacter marinus]|uniref:Thiamine biosynthesis protein ThiC n=1 Tax=Aurantiacibacter marinus TaxID=874156 RepID=A0A0H0XLZ4_9SPHN|nr:hypothetical protein [Aurantiacibacter marinus]KLI62977.1 hypothetical protein AAV99_13140 [Aurantiacibacter marinus]